MAAGRREPFGDGGGAGSFAAGGVCASRIEPSAPYSHRCGVWLRARLAGPARTRRCRRRRPRCRRRGPCPPRPMRMPSTSAPVNTEPRAASSPCTGSPSKEYSVPREAVSTTRPRPSPTRRSPIPRSSSPLEPWANAPLKQQSRITTCRRARQSSSWSSSQCASTPEDGEPVLDRVPGREVEPPAQVDQAVAGQVDQEQVVGAPVGEEVLDREPDLLRLLVDHRGDREAADLGIGQQVAQVCGVAGGCTQPPQRRVDVVGDSDHQRQRGARRTSSRGRRLSRAIRTSPAFSPARCPLTHDLCS